jgi:hypothetical protein
MHDYRKYGFTSPRHVRSVIDIIEHSHCAEERASVTSAQYRYLFASAFTSSILGINYTISELDSDGYAHFYWGGSDRFPGYINAFLNNPQKRAQLIHCGWADQYGNPVKTIDYRVNSDGFRCDHFDHRPGIAFFGCSHTYGVGLNEPDTWPYKVASHYNTQCWNLGAPGQGLMPGTYFAVNWLDQALPNLDAIVVMEPPRGRVPMVRCNGDNSVGFFSVADTVAWAVHQHNTAELPFVNAMMDSLMLTSDFHRLQCVKTLELIAKYRNIPFVVFDSDIGVTFKGSRQARDTHHSEFWHTAIAQKYIAELDKYFK